MGFSLYWKWEKPIADAEKFAAWSQDVLHLLAHLTALEHTNNIPAIFSSEKNFMLKEKEDGSPSLIEIDPPRRKENWLVICGPDGTGEPIFTPVEVAFNGNKSIGEDCQSFSLSLKDLEKAPFWCDCKTGYNPYSCLAMCTLARFIHYFPEAAIYTDEGEEPVTKAVDLCKQVFGETSSPRPWD